jgi:HSP20 family protein
LRRRTSTSACQWGADDQREKSTETEDKDRLFSERHYGRFERRIPVDDIDEENVTAVFKNGLLTVTLPKLASAKTNVRRIAINGS